MQALEYDQNLKQGLHLRKGRPPDQGKIRYETPFLSFSIFRRTIFDLVV